MWFVEKMIKKCGKKSSIDKVEDTQVISEIVSINYHVFIFLRIRFILHM